MKKSAKALVIAMIIVLTCGVLAGCGSKDEGKDADTKTYIAATEPTYPPFDTTDEEGNIVKAIPEGVSIPPFVPQGLFAHNIKEFTNLAAILPTLYAEEKDTF